MSQAQHISTVCGKAEDLSTFDLWLIVGEWTPGVSRPLSNAATSSDLLQLSRTARNTLMVEGLEADTTVHSREQALPASAAARD